MPKFMVEAHAGRPGDTQVQMRVHEMLNKVRNAYGARGWGDDCPISVVFVRDPLDFYISLYRWAVIGNQDQKAEFLSQGGYVLNGKYVWGEDLLEWAPDNAMSRVMAGHLSFFDRKFFQLRWFLSREGRFYDRGTGPAFTPGTWNFTQTKYENLREALSGYDIVAPVSHVDYVMAMLQLLYGWDEPPFYEAVRPVRAPSDSAWSEDPFSRP